MTDFTAKLKQFSARFNDKLPALFAYPSGSEQQVSRAMFYSLSNGGKRLRPYLVCEVANLFGISEDISFPVAASLEMLHNAHIIKPATTPIHNPRNIPIKNLIIY